MKILLLNTTDLKGGAAIACYRVFDAQVQNGLDTKLLVWEKYDRQNDRVIEFAPSWMPKRLREYNHYLEKLAFLPHEASKTVRFSFSTAYFGTNILRSKEVQEADIIHLHWTTKGFISLRSIKDLAQLGKPIVWTLHDMWAFTGGCHYADACTRFQESCGKCFFLKNNNEQDLSREVWAKKQQIYSLANLHIVTSSKWLGNIAASSSLLRNYPIQSIPTPINANLYIPKKQKRNSQFNILFQAMNIADIRKGFKYFLEGLQYLKRTYPAFCENIKLTIFGKNKGVQLSELGFEITELGFLDSQKAIVAACQQADVFVIPSLQDNLPNAVMESLSCGVPVVAFNTGGIPEMVEHKFNGYITEQKNSEGLAEGIKWVLEEEDRYQKLSANARQKVEDTYSYAKVSAQYHTLYQQLLS